MSIQDDQEILKELERFREEMEALTIATNHKVDLVTNRIDSFVTNVNDRIDRLTGWFIALILANAASVTVALMAKGK